MIFSIRNFLLLNLLLTMVLSAIIIGVGNYYLDQKDIHEHLDALLVQTGLSYSAIVGTQETREDWDQLQKALNQATQRMDKAKVKYSSDLPAGSLYFQISDRAGHILLRAPEGLPELPIPPCEILCDVTVNNQAWRVFAAKNAATGINVLVGERYESRSKLRQLIAADDIYILLLAFPISGLLIWLIVGRGLNSLARVVKEVAHRAPVNLSPVQLTAVPVEILPLVAELNHLFKRLEEAFDREKRFAGDAAHELRTPLAALKTQAQVVLSAKTLKEKNEGIKKLMGALERSIYTVEQLLTMTKLTPEFYDKSQLSLVDVIPIVQESMGMLLPKADEKNIELVFDTQLEQIFVHGNQAALSILIRNLVGNAIRYSPSQTTIEVQVFEDETKVYLEVKDEGPGIEPKLRGRVFERFYRIVGSEEMGSGLGLAIVRQICDLHHASIHLASREKGHGLVVRVAFPKSCSLSAN